MYHKGIENESEEMCERNPHVLFFSRRVDVDHVAFINASLI